MDNAKVKTFSLTLTFRPKKHLSKVNQWKQFGNHQTKDHNILSRHHIGWRSSFLKEQQFWPWPLTMWHRKFTGNIFSLGTSTVCTKFGKFQAKRVIKCWLDNKLVSIYLAESLFSKNGSLTLTFDNVTWTSIGII